MTETKWQRIRYMNGIPMGEDGRRVTGSQRHIDLSRKAAAEGMVLLKNDASLLPFERGQKLAVFGKAQKDYVKGGGGSGEVTVAYVRSLLDGLRIKEKEGKVQLYGPLSDYYEENVRQQYLLGVQPGRTVEPGIPEELLDGAGSYTDTAVITICRFSGESYDRTGEPFDGDFYLSREEARMVEQVRSRFSRIAIVLNTGGMMDTLWFQQDDRIGAALLAWQGGMEGGLAEADVLCGDVCPSGRLTDTFACDFDAYPSSAGFNESENYVEYQEDIFVGYRYFETVPGADKKVVYPFGYGLSYTEFSLSDLSCRIQGEQILFSAKVTNTGSRAGKQVVQWYCRLPKGKLEKPSLVLIGFAKTGCLQPGEAQVVSVTASTYSFASYDDTGEIEKSAYVLEKGTYRFLAGENIRDLQPIGTAYEAEEDKILSRCKERCAPNRLTKRMRADGSFEELEQETSPWVPDGQEKLTPFDGESPAECPWKMPYSVFAPPTLPQLEEVYQGKLELEQFMELLADEEKIYLLGGKPNRGIANTFGIGNLPAYGIPNVMTADGPAGLRILPKCGVTTTAFPCATLLACTWNTDLVREVGQAGAEEVKENGIGVWLTPAINIHRSPLCGRNFEYYSEDPYLAGKMAAAMVAGIQSQGIAASLKHFACNNKETNRRNSDSRVSERALREIYLKAFEICVKEAQPWTVMSSYNLVNGVRASENRELLTEILRNEWGFQGLVTTDWYTYGLQAKEIMAGNDVKMAAGMPEHTLQMLREGKLDRCALETSVRRVLELILKIG